jgi:hypothetical protein
MVGEFKAQTFFIGGFEQSRAKRSVYFDGQPNDTLCERISLGDLSRRRLIHCWFSLCLCASVVNSTFARIAG